MSKSFFSFKDNIKVAKLGKGIHDNVVLLGCDTEMRKSKEGLSKKMLYLTFAKVDVNKDRKKLREVELSWWKPNPADSKYFDTNMLEMFYQIDNLLKCYYEEEEIDKAFDDMLTENKITSLVDKKWKVSEINNFLPLVCEVVGNLLKPKVGAEGQLLHLKVAPDYKGVGVELPKFGAFVETMGEEETTLKFTKAEMKNSSNAGITEEK
jgi:hypothetical protein